MMPCVLNGHQEGIKSCSIDLTYLTAGKQRFLRWQTPLFTLFTIVSLCLSKFTLNQKMHVYHLGLFHCTECTSLFQLLASRKPLLNMAQGIKFKGRPVGQLKYLTMTMAFSKKVSSHSRQLAGGQHRKSQLRPSPQKLSHNLKVEEDHRGCGH